MKMNTMKTASLEAPKITPAQRKELEAHKRNLEELIRDAESVSRKVGELRKKEKSLEDEAAKLHRAAAKFDRDAEIKLAATLKQIERVHEAIQEVESSRVPGEVDFRVVNQAQDCIGKLCQVSFHELEEKIMSALSPYYGPPPNQAIYVARNAPAMNHFITSFLSHRMIGAESGERIVEGAIGTLGKVDALLTGGQIWSYDAGGESKSALEPAEG
jgi:hypothetical protein